MLSLFHINEIRVNREETKANVAGTLTKILLIARARVKSLRRQLHFVDNWTNEN